MIFTNNGGVKKLIHTLSSCERANLLELRMIRSNTPKNFIYTEYDSKNKTFEYRIDGYVSIKEFRKIFKRSEVIVLLQNIASVLNHIPEYMLKKENLILEPEYIFLKVQSEGVSDETGDDKKENLSKIYNDIKFIYLPLNREYINSNEEAVNLETYETNSVDEKLAKILSSLVFDMSEDTLYVAEILNYLNGNRNFNADEFFNLLQKISEDEERIKIEGTRGIKSETNTEYFDNYKLIDDSYKFIEDNYKLIDDNHEFIGGRENLFDGVSLDRNRERNGKNERAIDNKALVYSERNRGNRIEDDREYRNMFSVEKVSEEFNTEKFFNKIPFKNTFFKGEKNKTKNILSNHENNMNAGVANENISINKSSVNKKKVKNEIRTSNDKRILKEENKRKKLNIISNNAITKNKYSGEITLWYLLNHFSRENLNKYKNREK